MSILSCMTGDGAGVGKGRTIAGIIFENFLKGRKRAIWVSVSNDLKYDAERDLHDIGAGRIEVHPLNKVCDSIFFHVALIRCRRFSPLPPHNEVLSYNTI